MKKRNYLNFALLIIGISILILGTVLFFTAPEEMKDSFKKMHISRYIIENGERHYQFGRDTFPGHNTPAWKGSNGRILILPMFVLVLVLIIGIGKIVAGNFFLHKRSGYRESPENILRRSYADGRITREEYLDRKNNLEKGKEV